MIFNFWLIVGFMYKISLILRDNYLRVVIYMVLYVRNVRFGKLLSGRSGGVKGGGSWVAGILESI